VTYLVWQKFTDVSKASTASIYRTEEKVEQPTSKRQLEQSLVSPQYQYVSIRLYGVTSQKTVLFTNKFCSLRQTGWIMDRWYALEFIEDLCRKTKNTKIKDLNYQITLYERGLLLRIRWFRLHKGNRACQITSDAWPPRQLISYRESMSALHYNPYHHKHQEEIY
jgi:hypothetical protein